MDQTDLVRRFTYHAPPDDLTIETYQMLRSYAMDFAGAIDISQPDSREKSLAITKLEECVMWANAGIARNGLKGE